ncbi:hypothetical protein DFP72DRAFT_860974 [Ephemerocybe angulata]|uniref:Uncharacterized protein n=1 Tax=Ephemerocybe angulata TaxID=980116 RepID=A0A8H6H9T6_9AGAR|nr:hypothetical protein DFP72DRAFT_860974 [Tulosesus angulatus]
MPLATSVRRMCHAPVRLSSAFFTATPQSHAIPKRPPLPSPIATPRKLQHTQTPSAKLSKVAVTTSSETCTKHRPVYDNHITSRRPSEKSTRCPQTPLPDFLARRPIDERGQSSQHLANQTQRLTESNVATTETKAFVIRAFEGVSVSMDSCRPTRGVLTSAATENEGYSSPGSFNKLLQTPLAAHRLRRTPASQPHSPKTAPHAPPNRIAGRRRSGITPTGAGPTLACGMCIATRTVSKRVSDRRNITLTGDRTPGHFQTRIAASINIGRKSMQTPLRERIWARQRVYCRCRGKYHKESTTYAPKMGRAHQPPLLRRWIPMQYTLLVIWVCLGPAVRDLKGVGYIRGATGPGVQSSLNLDGKSAAKIRCHHLVTVTALLQNLVSSPSVLGNKTWCDFKKIRACSATRVPSRRRGRGFLEITRAIYFPKRNGTETSKIMTRNGLGFCRAQRRSTSHKWVGGRRKSRGRGSTTMKDGKKKDETNYADPLH